jgi:hypothetical protein
MHCVVYGLLATATQRGRKEAGREGFNVSDFGVSSPEIVKPEG